MRNTDPDRVFDGLLVQQYLNGDAQAMSLLIKRWNNRIIAYAMRMTQDREHAKDIAQEVWLAAVRNIKRLQNLDNVGSWLLSITHNKCMDTHRMTSKEKELKNNYKPIQDSENDIDSDEVKKLRRAIRHLKDDHRIILSLFYLEGMSLIEISDILKISKGTVKSRLFHAREKLKNSLK